jgi:hypothetical protein
MSSIHTEFAMHAVPAVSARSVVAGMRCGLSPLPMPTRSFDFGTAGIAFT